MKYDPARKAALKKSDQAIPLSSCFHHSLSCTSMSHQSEIENLPDIDAFQSGAVSADGRALNDNDQENGVAAKSEAFGATELEEINKKEIKDEEKATEVVGNGRNKIDKMNKQEQSKEGNSTPK